MKEALKHLAHESIKKALKTAEEIMGDNDCQRLDCEDLDDLKDCWEIIDHAAPFCDLDMVMKR